jgi:hypothetical protein
MPDEVTVSGRADGDFDVEVRRGATVTRHVVRVPPAMGEALGRPDIDCSELVRVSFEFLLEREPPTSILPSFGLDVVERYFPDYRRDMARRLA